MGFVSRGSQRTSLPVCKNTSCINLFPSSKPIILKINKICSAKWSRFTHLQQLLCGPSVLNYSRIEVTLALHEHMRKQLLTWNPLTSPSVHKEWRVFSYPATTKTAGQYLSLHVQIWTGGFWSLSVSSRFLCTILPDLSFAWLLYLSVQTTSLFANVLWLLLPAHHQHTSFIQADALQGFMFFSFVGLFVVLIQLFLYKWNRQSGTYF